LPAQAATPAGIGCERVQYDARVLRVVDGDTVDFQVLLGFDVERYIRGRLYGVDTPEVYGAAKVAGKAASDFTRQWLAACGGAVLIAERGKDKYGRWLVMVDCRGQDLAAALVASKHAVEALY
jgi:micrococcal nuclease